MQTAVPAMTTCGSRQRTVDLSCLLPHASGVDVQHLRCFVAVAEELHFGRAAERLHLTPSPVSRSVKELERELGTELFVRRYHAVALTTSGQALVEPARELLKAFVKLKETARAASGNLPRVFRLGGTHPSPPEPMDAVLEETRRLFPDAETEIVVATSSGLFPLLERGELDLAVVHLPFENASLDVLPLAACNLSVAMLADDELASSSELTLQDLAGRTIILQPSRVQPVAMARLRRYLESAGITSFHEMTETDARLAASYVRRSRELSLTMTSAGGYNLYQPPTFAMIPIHDEGLQVRLGVAWRRSVRGTDDQLELVIDSLLESFADKPMTLY